MSNKEAITTALRKLELSQERTKEWLASQELDDADIESIVESIAESSVVEDSCCDDSCTYGTDTEREEEVHTLTLGTTQINTSNVTTVITDTLRDLINSINSVQTVGDVNITNSTNVHIGNVTNINGNIQIIAQNTTNDQQKQYKQQQKQQSYTRNTQQQQQDREQRSRNRRSAEQQQSRRQREQEEDDDEETEEHVHDDAFIARQKFKIPKELYYITPRHSWLAQKPMEEYQYLEEPVQYVVILHTATESSVKRAINVRLIRDIQCFHIESRGWNDIAYNFLIGCDGNIYEGRGWGVIGAHTRGYNKKSIGISFVGCFMSELPTPAALTMCKNLLARGVKEGHLAPDYRLVCHCQCNSTESPGRQLFNEIQTWEHFYNLEEEEEE